MLSLASFQNLCCAAPTPVSCVTMLCTLANTIIQLSFRTPNVKNICAEGYNTYKMKARI